MSKKTHTPAPWEIEYDNSDTSRHAWYNVGPATVDVSDSLEQTLLDVALIKAAPDMLKTINVLASWLVCSAITTPEDMAQSFEEMYHLCEKTIKEATTTHDTQ